MHGETLNYVYPILYLSFRASQVYNSFLIYFLWKTEFQVVYISLPALVFSILNVVFIDLLNYYTNCLNCSVIFLVCTQFTEVAAGRIIQPGRQRVGDS